MRKALLWIFSLAVTVVATLAATRVLDRHQEPGGELQREAAEAPAPRSPQAAGRDETNALRAEMARRDALIGSLLAAKALAGARGEDRSKHEPSAEAARVFDGRLGDGARPSPALAQMGTAIRELERAGVLGETRLTDLKCGGVLCRITLSDQAPDRLEQSTRRLVESAGKAVGALVVLDGEAGQKLLYAATTSRDLELPADGTTLAAQEADERP